MKIVGIGLNKTGTKTLRQYLLQQDLRHQSYDLKAFELYRKGDCDSLLKWMEDFDSFEDWPWPLMYREIDAHFPDAKFILTKRKSPGIWYKSLCKMAIRMGPFNDFEKHIYGYAMPHGRSQEHFDFYEKHNREVLAHFADRPGKLLSICWEDGDDYQKLADFLGFEATETPVSKVNTSLPVYGGDNLWLAQFHRIRFQTKWKIIKLLKKLKQKLTRGS